MTYISGNTIIIIGFVRRSQNRCEDIVRLLSLPSVHSADALDAFRKPVKLHPEICAPRIIAEAYRREGNLQLALHMLEADFSRSKEVGDDNYLIGISVWVAFISP